MIHHPDVRLRTALEAGIARDPAALPELIERCGVEPDFSVRDTLTWAITRYPASSTVPLLLAELGSEVPQARSQALHTLSKIGADATWPAITRELLTDADDEVARSAWRTAVVLVPDDERAALARVLVTQFGRGDEDVRRSLSRALVALGDDATAAVTAVRTHAEATMRLAADPDSGFAANLDQARRVVALGPEGAP
ncbi:MAG: HEAT repeat domain-containing protein [Gordonia sp. (in: high G+C Gram-positive bacteria)]